MIDPPAWRVIIILKIAHHKLYENIVIIIFQIKDNGILINDTIFLFHHSETVQVLNWSSEDINKQNVTRIK